jgi:hypothetical protein
MLPDEYPSGIMRKNLNGHELYKNGKLTSVFVKANGSNPVFVKSGGSKSMSRYTTKNQARFSLCPKDLLPFLLV